MSPATVAAVCGAFDASDRDGMLDSRLRPAARMVCDDARTSGLRVEQLLIALKTEWSQLLTSRRIEDVAERADLTSRFITLCIHEFYAESPARGAAASMTDGVNHTPTR
jgi:hypothetical protein